MASLDQLKCESFAGPSARGDEGGVEEEEGGDSEGEREAQLEPDDGAVQERGGRPHQQEVDGRDQGMTRLDGLFTLCQKGIHCNAANFNVTFSK